MQLLYSSTIPVVEFASVSLLLHGSPDVGESIMVASPLSTTPFPYDSLLELQQYLLSIHNAATSGVPQTCLEQLAADDARQADARPQLFTSRHSGISLYHWMVKDADFIHTAFSVLMSTNNKGRYKTDQVAGVVVCVGVSGCFAMQPSSPLVRSILPRLLDVVLLMRRMNNSDAEECKLAYKALLTTLLLTEDEERRTNGMVESEQVTMELESELHQEQEHHHRKGGRVKNKIRGAGMKRGVSSDLMNATLESASSADISRLLEKRAAVLSVIEKDCHLRKYTKDATGSKGGSGGGGSSSANMTKEEKKNRRRLKNKPDEVFRDFDYTTPQQAKSSVAAMAALAAVKMKNQQSNATIPKIGALSKKDTTPKASALAPPRQQPKTSRRTDKTRKAQQQAAAQAAAQQAQKQTAFDAFAVESDHGGSLEGSFTTSIDFPGLDSMPNHQQQQQQQPSGKRNRRSLPDVLEEGNRNASRNRFGNGSTISRGTRDSISSTGFDPFSVDGSASTPNSASRQRSSSDDEPGSSNGITNRAFMSSPPPPPPPTPPPSSTKGNLSAADGAARILVNVALNEDLTCSYKQSKISSCTIEGVVQVQVKSNAPNATCPFYLLLRDPSRHIRMIQENRRYADDKTDLLTDADDDGVDYKFEISVPKAQNYFPVMRYKCSQELRPVPIRVQTRVRNSQGFCRVALQISSNPANEDDLTDLTIIMGVPEEVKGESLTTSPSGGVWNANKRSVIWCVAELGDGEKFQLQAQFEIEPAMMEKVEKEKPKFPVLVRCQCMYAQLSDIELEVTDIPTVLPADVAMKLARRFRLAHRERS